MKKTQDPGQITAQITKYAKSRGPAPVHLWNPEFCGDLDMRIARDGSWFYMGTPVGRKAMVKLFASVIRKDDDQYFLVTPVEKVGITVEDAPFVAVSLEVIGEGPTQILRFSTNVDDVVEAGPDNPITIKIDKDSSEPSPYVLVRTNLQALIVRSVFYQLVELAQEKVIDGEPWWGVWSQGEFFKIGQYK